MLLSILSFLSGDLFLQFFSSLPSRYHLVIALPIILLLSYFVRSMIPMGWILAFVAGFLWTSEYARYNLQKVLPKELEKKSLVVRGYIASIPVTNQWQTTFLLVTDHHKNYRISWRAPPRNLKVGDKWELWVKLKRIHSTQNFNTFDYERWALLNGLHATGYVLEKNKNKFLYHDPYKYGLNQFRQVLNQKLSFLLPTSNTSHWLMALLIGERQGIKPEEWEVLRKTGTNHLMAIAGLHIGIVGGLVYFLFYFLWRCVPTLTLYVAAHHAAALFSLVATIFYSACAGFSLPTTRACLMLTFHVCTFLCKRHTHAWESWSFALLTVLILNPLSVLSESFWLSFVTIALIIYGMHGRLAPGGWWWKWGRVQWVIGFGLIPLSIWFFNECSLISTFANTIAIPILSFAILPFCLLAMIFLLFSPTITHFLLFIADMNLSIMWKFLLWCTQLPFATWTHTIPSFWIGISSGVGILLLLLPIGLPGRWLGLGWMLPLIFFKSPTPAKGEIWLTLLDVGQGLAAIVQTHSHLLIYDTGNKFQNFDAGKSIILPFLATIHSNIIDMLVISHGDNDHCGGANALLENTKIKQVLTSVPEKFQSASFCFAGLAWEWDGVIFDFISPQKKEKQTKNNLSCVLRVRNRENQVLFPGDIEKKAESFLSKTYGSKLRANILIAPHHGSNTSSTQQFIDLVHPIMVLYATGYANRYHFPHPKVCLRYQRLGVAQYDTKDTGLMHFRMNVDGTITAMFFRKRYKKYWML